MFILIIFRKRNFIDSSLTLFRFLSAVDLFKGCSTWRRSSYAICVSRGDWANSVKDDVRVKLKVGVEGKSVYGAFKVV